MKKKISNKEIGEVIGKLAEQVRTECDFELQTALIRMSTAESELVKTFNDKQRALYSYFCQKREDFYAIASELYKKRF